MSDVNVSVRTKKNAKKLEKDDLERMIKDYGSEQALNYRIFEPGNFILSENFLKYEDRYYNFKFRPDDVVVMSFPKSGSTWAQEVVWTMRHNPNLDHPMAFEKVNMRSPFLEFDMMADKVEDHPFYSLIKEKCPDKKLEDGMIMQYAETLPRKRVIKTHLALSFFHSSLLETCKIIYVTRNPYDVLQSYYHFVRMFHISNFKGSLEDFLNYFIEDKVMFGPYWATIREAADHMGHPNLMFLKYEDMKADTLKQIQKLNQFIDSGLSEKQMENIVHYTSFSEMKNRDQESTTNNDIATSDFFRKGEAGTGKQQLTEDQKNKMEIWINKNTNENRSKISKIIHL